MRDHCVGGYLTLLGDGVSDKTEGFDAVGGRGDGDGHEGWEGCWGGFFCRGGRCDGKWRRVRVGEEGGGLRWGGGSGHCTGGEGVGI